MVIVRYIGHAAFLIEAGEAKMLIDPYLSGNSAAVAPKGLKPDLILVTHAHGDHLGDAIEISKKTGVSILTTNEIANYCITKGAKAIDAHIGGKISFPFGTVKLFPAVHSSSVDGISLVGVPCSFVITVDGKSIYHAGDTALFGDMKLIGEEFKLDVALLPIGGHYTMGIDDAVRAAKLLNARTIVPMHYDTFDVIKANPFEFCKKVKTEAKLICVILRPGEKLTLQRPELSSRDS
jgi:L-ascorbate metabolism protein UlaG (beta-lactamase superfamily)